MLDQNNHHLLWDGLLAATREAYAASEALFLRHGEAPEVLRPGQTSAHASNQPHAMETFDHPVMALVVWRNGFDNPPVLSA